MERIAFFHQVKAEGTTAVAGNISKLQVLATAVKPPADRPQGRQARRSRRSLAASFNAALPENDAEEVKKQARLKSKQTRKAKEKMAMILQVPYAEVVKLHRMSPQALRAYADNLYKRGAAITGDDMTSRDARHSYELRGRMVEELAGAKALKASMADNKKRTKAAAKQTAKEKQAAPAKPISKEVQASRARRKKEEAADRKAWETELDAMRNPPAITKEERAARIKRAREKATSARRAKDRELRRKYR